ncbi:HNH endonuclease [Photobacterium alginatilyticum]|nr:HNH endonuclease signature motif containing protein [Photobacterium alginatilyticum]
MVTFSELNSRIVHDYVAKIKNEIYEEEYYNPFSETFYLDEKRFLLALKPQKWTLLHECIEDSILDGLNYALKKNGYDFYERIYRDFDIYGVKYVQVVDELRGTSHCDYLISKYKEEVCPRLVPSIFNILFSDRSTMRQFNRIVADHISKLSEKEYPEYLKKDGVMKRNNYWPKWLREALNRREQGHCAAPGCQKNLTGMLANGNEQAIDHIVPLNQGGVNDPTNLQMLCTDCNQDKGGNNDYTSDMYSLYW